MRDEENKISTAICHATTHQSDLQADRRFREERSTMSWNLRNQHRKHGFAFIAALNNTPFFTVRDGKSYIPFPPLPPWCTQCGRPWLDTNRWCSRCGVTDDGISG